MNTRKIGKAPTKGDLVLIDAGGKHIPANIQRKSNGRFVILADNNRQFFIPSSKLVPHMRYPNAWFVGIRK